jgi:hypothetical protein
MLSGGIERFGKDMAKVAERVSQPANAVCIILKSWFTAEIASSIPGIPGGLIGGFSG